MKWANTHTRTQSHKHKHTHTHVPIQSSNHRRQQFKRSTVYSTVTNITSTHSHIPFIHTNTSTRPHTHTTQQTGQNEIKTCTVNSNRISNSYCIGMVATATPTRSERKRHAANNKNKIELVVFCVFYVSDREKNCFSELSEWIVACVPSRNGIYALE